MSATVQSQPSRRTYTNSNPPADAPVLLRIPHLTRNNSLHQVTENGIEEITEVQTDLEDEVSASESTFATSAHSSDEANFWAEKGWQFFIGILLTGIILMAWLMFRSGADSNTTATDNVDVPGVEASDLVPPIISDEIVSDPAENNEVLHGSTSEFQLNPPGQSGYPNLELDPAALQGALQNQQNMVTEPAAPNKNTSAEMSLNSPELNDLNENYTYPATTPDTFRYPAADADSGTDQFSSQPVVQPSIARLKGLIPQPHKR